MKKILHTIFSSGMSPDNSFALNNKIRIFNVSAVIIGITSFIYAILTYELNLPYAAVFTFSSAVMMLICFLLVRYRKYAVAFHLAIIFAFVFVSSFTPLFGLSTGTFQFLFFLPVVAALIFDNKVTSLYYFIVTAILLVLNLSFANRYQPVYPDFASKAQLFNLCNSVFTAILIFLGVRQFKTENQKFAKKIEEQKHILEEKNKDITDSINYAKHIQSSYLPPADIIPHFMPESFMLFKPKDVVSGDFYWAYCPKDENGSFSSDFFVCAADCTGHGVPGAIMSVICCNALNDVVVNRKEYNPARILDLVRDHVIQILKSNRTDGRQDGMDTSLICINRLTGDLQYAGANNPLWIYRKATNSIEELKSDKQPVGIHHIMKPFSLQKTVLNGGDIAFLFSDGYADQFGGEKGKKFKYRQLQQLLLDNADKAMPDLKSILENRLLEWQGNLEQADDVLVIGIRYPG